jgi:drug/metabolite transporter (DMT)-like permease
MFIFALIAGKPFTFEATTGYILSLVYLAVFGSVIAFGAYLTLLGQIGADRAGYSSLLFPIVALGLSTLFEGYQWSAAALTGVLLVVGGNFLVLWRQRSKNGRQG